MQNDKKDSADKEVRPPIKKKNQNYNMENNVCQ